MDYFESKRRNDLVREEEVAGKVADSLEWRMAIMARVHAGEITLEAAQAELKRVKRTAKAKGLTTRARVWSGR